MKHVIVGSSLLQSETRECWITLIVAKWNTWIVNFHCCKVKYVNTVFSLLKSKTRWVDLSLSHESECENELVETPMFDRKKVQLHKYWRPQYSCRRITLRVIKRPCSVLMRNPHYAKRSILFGSESYGS